ncbi:MAG TPA: hypothetical protein VKG01_09670, partial [Thermoanaerobaculia bacterium]|nr:hypothetical protein [Thermoanaerobaculia bacterium]
GETMRWNPGRASCAFLVAAAVLGVSCSKEKGSSDQAAAKSSGVTRRDVAKYVIQARGESPASGCTTPFFTDVPCSDPGWGWIEKMRTDELTKGCDPPKPLFCPDASITRAQAAMFVSRSANGGEASVPVSYGPDAVTRRSYSCDAAKPSLHFKDVTTSDIFCQHAHFVWAKGAIPEADVFRPKDSVTKAEMDEMVLKGFEVRKQ